MYTRAPPGSQTLVTHLTHRAINLSCEDGSSYECYVLNVTTGWTHKGARIIPGRLFTLSLEEPTSSGAKTPKAATDEKRMKYLSLYPFETFHSPTVCNHFRTTRKPPSQDKEEAIQIYDQIVMGP